MRNCKEKCQCLSTSLRPRASTFIIIIIATIIFVTYIIVLFIVTVIIIINLVFPLRETVQVIFVDVSQKYIVAVLFQSFMFA